MLQRQQPQETFTAQEETLSKQLTEGSADAAHQTLASLEASEALQLLVRVLARDETKAFRKFLITKYIFVASFSLLSIWALFHLFRDPSNFKSENVLPIMISLGIATMFSGSQIYSQRNRTAALLLPDLVPRLNRTDIPLVLELAPQANLNDNALFMWLGYGLGRMPIDELAALSPESRKGLCHVTQAAVEKSTTEQMAETLAVAGLLALGSLKDPSLKIVAEQAVLQHTHGQVSTAADEYLNAL